MYEVECFRSGGYVGLDAFGETADLSLAAE
jgi:hypothetical protein